MQRSTSFSLSHFVGTQKLASLMEPSDLQVAEKYFGRMNASEVFGLGWCLSPSQIDINYHLSLWTKGS